MFIGRVRELAQLAELLAKEGASLVICRGRRRIGKSTLVETFGKTASQFLQFQGLPPRDHLRAADQLSAFAEALHTQTELPKLTFDSWPQAFAALASQIRNDSAVVLLDEISWLAQGDPDFAGHLKVAWDTVLKKKPHLVLVLCGSVSAWIEANILNNTGFVGRVSLALTLDDLPLTACNEFWKKNKNRIASREKLKLLSVTGGVPRYLEEIRPAQSAEENIRRLCFVKEGLLFNEFEHIFASVLSGRAATQKAIVAALSERNLERTEIANAIGWERGGRLSEHLEELALSGFVTEDAVFKIRDGKASRFARYRLSDCYLRFYLRWIAPLAANIKKGLYHATPLENIIPWESVIGLQFETLILKNLTALFPLLGIHPAAVRASAPYFQKKTQRQAGCQIDLLVQTRHSLYLCEMKTGRRLGMEVIDAAKEKARRLVVPRGMSVRHVLIYEGELVDGVEREGFFDFLVPFAALLSADPT